VFAHWNAYARTDLRIERRHLPLLLAALRLPAEIQLPNKKCKVTGEALLLILLYHLAFPRRLTDIQDKFQMHSTKLSLLRKVGIYDLYHVNKHRVFNIDLPM
jgi:hypothetical protein